jgi:DNA-binding NarL/FixJ family response regulator
MIAKRHEMKPGKPLNGREGDVLRLMADGLTNEEIGKHLYLTENTIKTHVSALLTKLRAANRVEAVMRGIELGLVPCRCPFGVAAREVKA